MPRQPSTLYPLPTQQQPFTLIHEHEAWHVTFPGHRCELDIHGSRIEAQAIARCYYSLFLPPARPSPTLTCQNASSSTWPSAKPPLNRSSLATPTLPTPAPPATRSTSAARFSTGSSSKAAPDSQSPPRPTRRDTLPSSSAPVLLDFYGYGPLQRTIQTPPSPTLALLRPARASALTPIRPTESSRRSPKKPKDAPRPTAGPTGASSTNSRVDGSTADR